MLKTTHFAIWNERDRLTWCTIRDDDNEQALRWFRCSLPLVLAEIWIADITQADAEGSLTTRLDSREQLLNFLSLLSPTSGHDV